MKQRSSLVQLKSTAQTAVRIICFPFAGGNAAFTRSWAKLLPDGVELLGAHYPDASCLGPCARTPHTIASYIQADLERASDVPLIFFGYSLGALVAYESCQLLRREHIADPIALVVAASRAPHLPRKRPPVSGLPEAEFIARLRMYGGTPDAVLADEALLRHFIPGLREDFATAERYQFSPHPPLRCPIAAMGGKLDNTVSQSELAQWRSHTSAAFELQELDGGHFFLFEHMEAVLSLVSRFIHHHGVAGSLQRLKKA